MHENARKSAPRPASADSTRTIGSDGAACLAFAAAFVRLPLAFRATGLALCRTAGVECVLGAVAFLFGCPLAVVFVFFGLTAGEGRKPKGL